MIPVLLLLFGGSTFMLIVFMSTFMWVMCLAEAFAAMYCLGFNVAWDSIQAVSWAVYVDTADKEASETEKSSSLLSAIPEEALALLFDATAPHQAIWFSFIGSSCTSTSKSEEEDDQVQGQIQSQLQSSTPDQVFNPSTIRQGDVSSSSLCGWWFSTCTNSSISTACGSWLHTRGSNRWFCLQLWPYIFGGT